MFYQLMAIIVVAVMTVLGCASSVMAASSADAREVARLSNCQPKKVDVYNHTLGGGGTTIYRVDCNIPKTSGTEASGNKPPEALLISCVGSLCNLLRPVAATEK